ncbi:hypothetical protein KAR91_66140 [Candidatus Pacearchaeota archaeon]|nr:hypothetical protein [Candidatus Pacearchaeota archaeon]
MLLKDIVQQARNGELKNLSPKDKTDEVITGFVDLAMIALYSRFTLVTEEAIITLATGKSVYKLDGSDDAVKIMIDGSITYTTTGATQTVTTAVDEIVYYAVASGSTGTGIVGNYYRAKTIQVDVDLDTELFATDTTNWADLGITTIYEDNIPEDDVLQIVQAYDEVGEIPMNDDTTNAGIYTISYDAVQVPVTAEGAYISIIYKKNPTPIVYVDDTTFNTDTIRLPRQLIEPMLHYIGYRAHGSLDGNINAENNTHLMRFEASCKRAGQLGVVPMDALTRSVETKGFI